MSNPTSNFNWQMPTATDLVTDLPADFEVFGQAVDTSLADLKGGTSGQILAKNTNADMDFVWITNDVGDITAVTAGTGISGGGSSGAVTITNDMATTITTNGDLLYGTGSGTYTRRAIGSTGQVLTVTGGVPTWESPAGGGKVLQVVSATKTDTFTTTSSSMVDVTDLSVSITPSATSSKILVMYDVQIYGKTGTFFAAMNLVRGTTPIKFGTGATSNRAAVTQVGFDFGQAYAGIPSGAGNYLDSPATTSATTYKIQVQRIGGTGSDIVCINRSNTDDDQSGRPRTASTITVMEIGA